MANTTLSLHQQLLLCRHYIIWSFLPSLQRKGFYMCGDVYLRINFFVISLFNTAENPLTHACASCVPLCCVIAMCWPSSPLCSPSLAAGCGHHCPLVRECLEPLSCCSMPFPAPQLSVFLCLSPVQISRMECEEPFQCHATAQLLAS